MLVYWTREGREDAIPVSDPPPSEPINPPSPLPPRIASPMAPFKLPSPAKAPPSPSPIPAAPIDPGYTARSGSGGAPDLSHSPPIPPRFSSKPRIMLPAPTSTPSLSPPLPLPAPDMPVRAIKSKCDCGMPPNRPPPL